MTKRVLLTFDYELFLGTNSGNLQRCLLGPTSRILSQFRTLGIQGIFFVDVLFYLRLLESDATAQAASQLRVQMQEIVAQGSRIELHLHPHWLDATYIDGQWLFPSYERYRLHSLAGSEVMNLFQSCTKVLNDIAREVRPDYELRIFRAGGFCIQPFDSLKEALIDNHLSIDSSVAPGLFEDGDVREYDFVGAPDLAYYSFSDDPTKMQVGGRFLELPIATYRINVWSKIKEKVLLKFSNESLPFTADGIGIPMFRPWWGKFQTEVRMITLDGYFLPSRLIQRITACKRDFATIIAHPKSIGSAYFATIQQMVKEGYIFVDYGSISKSLGKD